MTSRDIDSDDDYYDIDSNRNERLGNYDWSVVYVDSVPFITLRKLESPPEKRVYLRMFFGGYTLVFYYWDPETEQFHVTADERRRFKIVIPAEGACRHAVPENEVNDKTWNVIKPKSKRGVRIVYNVYVEEYCAIHFDSNTFIRSLCMNVSTFQKNRDENVIHDAHFRIMKSMGGGYCIVPVRGARDVEKALYEWWPFNVGDKNDG